MKPVALTMQAFGPFAGCEKVDFTLLGDDPLFLIHGPTGAGKSSILDAICVALYGDSAGGERRAVQMRSHHAPVDQPTEVAFEFILGAGRYRVRRSPEQQRPSRRARSGFATEPARAELSHWRNGSWHALAARPADVDREVRRLVGLDLEQFRQVVLLPQGRFREVLTADSNRREQILETLFATGVHRRLQEDLARQAAVLREQYARATEVSATLLAQRGLDTAATLAVAIDEAREALAGLSLQHERLAQREAAALAALEAARALAARFDEHAASAEALEALMADGARTRSIRERRDAARRAAGAAASYQRLVDARARLAAAGTELEGCEAASAGAAATRERCQDEWRRRRAEEAGVDRQREERRGLMAIAKEQDDLDAARRRAGAATAALAEAARAREVRATRFAADEATATALAGRVEALAAQAARVDACRAAVEHARLAADAMASLARARADAGAAAQRSGQARAARERAAATLLAARDAHERAFAAWRGARAGALAATLAEGDPCPVCGSASHPAPASMPAGGDGADDRFEQAAEALQQSLEADAEAARMLATAQADAAVARSRVEEREQAVAGGDTVAQAAGLAGCEAELAAARRAADELAVQRERLATLRDAIAAGRGQLDALGLTEQEARETAAAAQARLAERLDRIPEPWRDPQRLRARLDQLAMAIEDHDTGLRRADEAARAANQAMAVAAAAAEGARRAVVVATGESDAAQQGFLHECAVAGFADERACVEAMLPVAELAGLDRLVAGHEQAMAGARERLARAAAGIAGRERPDAEAAQQALAQLRVELQALVAARTRAELRLEEDTRLAARLAETAAAASRLERDFARVGRLADLAGGRNERRLTFQRYVLATLLDEVLVQASQRLRAMSRGRYWLRRREEVGDKRSAQGLDIEVFDDDTGRPRAVGTLSGGEGFLAALALALGLSDVVGAHAGGIRLETLFVDEGFGSLDSEALDLAMRALLDLRAQGRTIGIISHVDELRRQVGVGIEVVSGPVGSRIGGQAPGFTGMV